MKDKILSQQGLGFQWPTKEPFLFCAHHEDHYPEGNAYQGPKDNLSGRRLGQDFDLKNTWKMYHGMTVPGFPEHPHRGFETITIVLEGYVDHFDSMGAKGRYGLGDVQWMTAGAGMQHAEMFPLVNQTSPNPLHLFQIWLNLPQKHKFVEPHYKMLWHEQIPKVPVSDLGGIVTLIAGSIMGHKALDPTPHSWAADPENKVRILLVDLKAGEKLALDATNPQCNRCLYLYRGQGLSVDAENLKAMSMAELNTDDLNLLANQGDVRFLVLESLPIGEPIAQYGPFVMNTQEEIKEAYSDYHATQFGGWPWQEAGPVNDIKDTRFAHYGDGRIEKP